MVMMNLTQVAVLAALGSTLLAQESPAVPTVRQGEPPVPEIQAREFRLDRRPDEKRTEMTVDQRAKIEEANGAFRKVAEPLELRLRTARATLEQLVNAVPPDESAIKNAAREIGEVEGELAVARAHRVSRLREFLPPDMVRRYSFYSVYDRRGQPIPQPPPANIPRLVQ